MTAIVQCTGLEKKYHMKKVLNNVSMTISPQTITGLIGRNGAGKTTLLKIIAGFWRHTSGDIKVFGETPFHHLKVSANSIFVDDQMVFPESLALKEILEEANRFYPNWDARLAYRLFQYFNLNGRQLHHRLSKGQRSTFNMIIGLATRSPLTIFDEPTTGMDSAVRKDFYRALLKDYLAHPRTIILSSHHLEEIDDLLEDIVLIDNGEIVFHESMDVIREYAVELIGDESKVKEWTQDKDVLYEEKVGIDQLKMVVKNEFTDEELGETGFGVASVSANDVAIYLTNKSKGGIDGVFRT